MRNQASRGQALVLFSLTLFLMTAMALMTLSIGTRVKHKMELQTLADAAAYSNAVATARAFNSIAIMNRVMIAHTVSTLGAISLVSWATAYHRYVEAAARVYWRDEASFAMTAARYCLVCARTGNQCNACAACLLATAIVGATAGAFDSHAGDVNDWLQEDYERVYLPELEQRWNTSWKIYEAEVDLIEKLRREVSEPWAGVAGDLIESASLRRSGAVQASGAVGKLNLQELEEREAVDGALRRHAAPLSGDEPFHVASVVMGSRGHPFIRQRMDSTRLFTDKLLGIAPGLGLAFAHAESRGEGYLDPEWTRRPGGHPGGVWAHDEGGDLNAFLGPAAAICILPYAGSFYTGLNVRVDDARVGPEQHPGVHAKKHSDRTIPPFVDFNHQAVNDPDNLFGQPKNYVLLQREFVEKSDPWELRLSWQHSTGAGLDTVTSPLLAGRGGDKQLALGTGITYYHRRDHSDEPPNLFAPYWRAGLARSTIDRPGREGAFDLDLTKALSDADLGKHAEAYQWLVDSGYRGFQ